jgi:hypothetical protein
MLYLEGVKNLPDYVIDKVLHVFGFMVEGGHSW